jgi:adenylate cyclase
MLQVLSLASAFYMDLREPANADEVAERLTTLASDQQLPESVEGLVYRGWAMAQQGQTDKAIPLIRAALNSSVTLGGRPYRGVCLRALSETQARAGQSEEALVSIEEALSIVREMRIYLPGVLWWRGELQLRRGDEKKAADDFRETIAIARSMGSKAYELRATMSFARLLAKQTKRDQAQAMLADIYNWFTEGFDTADLKDAKALLEELSNSPS